MSLMFPVNGCDIGPRSDASCLCVPADGVLVIRQHQQLAAGRDSGWDGGDASSRWFSRLPSSSGCVVNPASLKTYVFSLFSLCHGAALSIILSRLENHNHTKKFLRSGHTFETQPVVSVT